MIHAIAQTWLTLFCGAVGFLVIAGLVGVVTAAIEGDEDAQAFFVIVGIVAVVVITVWAGTVVFG